MEEGKMSENHLTSAAAFVEGGIQEACDDACSICLEAFCESDPSTVTGCKHEFHLQCILEWCQRSSQCPMCWQSISLKDPSSQELLDGVEHERNIRTNPSRNTAIFHHPTLGDFELQHLPISASDAELEERIIQHLAAAAAMGRARHIARREGQRNRSSAQGRSQFLVFSTNSSAPPAVGGGSSPTQRSEGEPAAAMAVGGTTSAVTVGEESVQLITSPSNQTDQVSASASGSSIIATNQHGASSTNRSPAHSSPNNQVREGPSEFQSFSESLKSRINTMSTRYKESITRSTRGWKERLFSRNTSMADLGSEVRREVADLGSEVRREVNAGIATVSRMMERLETRDDNRTNTASISNHMEGIPAPHRADQLVVETGNNSLSENNIKASCATGSASD